jgi:hypothetical protein
MDFGFVARKAVHISAPLFLVYYVFPTPLWPGGISRESGLLLALALAMAFELARLVLGFRVLGMREYEAEQMSAGAWSAIALTFALLFFPLEMSAPVIVGMALLDPIIGILRKTKWYPWLPYALHVAIMVVVLSFFLQLDLRILLISLATSAMAVAAEGIKTRYVDDDFLMIALPLIGLAILLSV